MIIIILCFIYLFLKRTNLFQKFVSTAFRKISPLSPLMDGTQRIVLMNAYKAECDASFPARIKIRGGQALFGYELNMSSGN